MPGLLCVRRAARALNLMALEQAGNYRGLYHVLLGRIAPLEGVGPDQLTIDALVERVRTGGFREVIMGTNPTLEGDGTALYISNHLARVPVRDRRARARGFVHWQRATWDLLTGEILADALAGRQKF